MNSRFRKDGKLDALFKKNEEGNNVLSKQFPVKFLGIKYN